MSGQLGRFRQRNFHKKPIPSSVEPDAMRWSSGKGNPDSAVKLKEVPVECKSNPDFLRTAKNPTV